MRGGGALFLHVFHISVDAYNKLGVQVEELVHLLIFQWTLPDIFICKWRCIGRLASPLFFIVALNEKYISLKVMNWSPVAKDDTSPIDKIHVIEAPLANDENYKPHLPRFELRFWRYIFLNDAMCLHAVVFLVLQALNVIAGTCTCHINPPHKNTTLTIFFSICICAHRLWTVFSLTFHRSAWFY